MNNVGKLIVIDGGDGAGKATQARLLIDHLMADGQVVETMDFPRYQDNHFGCLLRECLDGKCGDFIAIDPKITATLFAADRFETKPILESWLQTGKTIVLDRYVSANFIHQSAKLEDKAGLLALLDWIEHMEFNVFGIPRPDITFYLDVPHDTRKELKSQSVAEGKHTGELDVAEQDQKHQYLSEERAREIVALKTDWHHIVCTSSSGILRNPEDIHEEIFGIVKDKLY